MNKGYHKLSYRTEFQGLPISVENRKGSYRTWYDPHNDTDGKTKMKYAYGYVRGTLGTDGDEVDVYIGPNKHSTKVYVITQMSAPSFSKVDEQKVMLGFNESKAAKRAYLAQYDDSRFFGSMKELSMDDFKSKLGSQKGKIIKALNDLSFAGIISNPTMKLVLPNSVTCCGPQEAPTKVDSLDRLRKACASLSTARQGLQSKKEIEVPSVSEKQGLDISKALKAIAVSGFTKRARLGAVYQLGQAAGKFHTEPALPVPILELNVGTVRARPTGEVPAAVAHASLAPAPSVVEPPAETKCVPHGYVHKSTATCPMCDRANISEVNPSAKRWAW